MAETRLLSRLFSRRRGDHAEDRTLTRATVPAAMLSSTPGGAVTPTSAMGIGDAYACVRALADAAASLPLIAYRRTGQGRERIDGHTADLLRSPAPGTTQAGLIGQLVAHLNLYGNAYVGKFRDGGGRVDQLALLHPDRVVPELRAGRPIFTVVGLNGERSVHTQDDVIHIRGLSTDGLVGMSPVRQCRVALGLSEQLAQHAATFFENSATPAGILRVSQAGPANLDLMDEMRGAWNDQHRGTQNSHRIAVVSGEVEFSPISMPLDDAEFLGQRKLSATEVARIFRVPPYMIGAESGASMTYSNVEQESLHFVTYGLRPHLVAIEQALSADPDLFVAPAYCEFLLDALLRADSKTRAEVYALALDPVAGWMSRDEVRRLENLEAAG